MIGGHPSSHANVKRYSFRAKPFIFGKLPSNFIGLACPLQPNSVACQCCAAVQHAFFFGASFGSASLLASTTQMEVRRVDLTMRLNVLAVCAVFVFVGAIVLGAF
jgi:hypothetical protein